jgi:hypothetical protein
LKSSKYWGKPTEDYQQYWEDLIAGHVTNPTILKPGTYYATKPWSPTDGSCIVLLLDYGQAPFTYFCRVVSGPARNMTGILEKTELVPVSEEDLAVALLAELDPQEICEY